MDKIKLKMKKHITILIVLIILDLSTLAYSRGVPITALQNPPESLARILFTKGFWFLVQQGWSLFLLIWATFYAIYILIIPFSGIGEEGGPADEEARSIKNNIESLSEIVLKSINPIDLTFGILDINDSHCRLRGICQLRKTISKMPLMETLFKSYESSVSDLEKYRIALDAGEAIEDCHRLFPECHNEPYEALPNFLQF